MEILNIEEQKFISMVLGLNGREKTKKNRLYIT